MMKRWMVGLCVLMSLVPGAAVAEKVAEQVAEGASQRGAAAQAESVGYQIRLFGGEKKFSRVRQGQVRLAKDLPGYSPRAVKLSPYGGAASRSFEATGYFYAKQGQDRWWLVDPEGHPYYMTGLAAVAPYDRRNEEVDFGPFEDVQDLARATTGGLRSMGFSCIGPWSFDADLQAQERPLNYTVSLYVMYSFAATHHGGKNSLHNFKFTNEIMPVLDPRFEAFAVEAIKKRIRPEWVGDPRLVGYFVDNELPWKADSLRRFLELEPENVNYQKTIAWLMEAEGMSAGDIEDLDMAALPEGVSSRFLGYIADTYYRTVRKALKVVDPNHLYLGSRIHGAYIRRQEVFEAMGEHVDVVSVNYYHRWTPRRSEMNQWAAWSGKPFMISEWYAKGADSGLNNNSGAGKLVATQEDRGKFYESFALGLLDDPSCVGWHWYKYKDSRFAGRNSNRGFFSQTFEPFGPLQKAAGAVNRQVYPLVEYFDAKR